MCCWMGSRDWIDCNVVRYFSIELLEWGHTFFWFLEVAIQNMCQFILG